MPSRRRSHSETFWSSAPASVVRCNATRPNGEQCKREAEPGSVVCDQHGGAAPQVRRRAAERVMMTADAAAAAMIEMMNDKSVPYGVRLKAMQDVLDRAGLQAKQVIEIGPKADDPVEKLFQSLLEEPDALAPPGVVAGEVAAAPDLAQEAVDRLEESWQPDAEILRPESFGVVGPHAYRGISNGNPRPAPPVPGWRPPDEPA